jgi:twinkle protein
MDLRELSAKLNDTMLATLRHLLPGGVVNGAEYCVGGLDGTKGQSLRVHMSGGKAGVWSDFSTGEAGGDLVDLWMAARHHSLIETMDEIRAWLGVERPKFVAPKKEYQAPIRPERMRKVYTTPVQVYLESRGMTSATIDAFRVAADGDRVLFPFIDAMGATRMIKFRDINDKKRQGPTSAGQMPILFGWQTIDQNTREVWITEGEFDAMAGYQLGAPCLSVPFGGGKGAKQQWIENEYDHLDRFETIILALDMDEEGEAAAREIAERLGQHRCLRVTLPHKDMNECLLEGADIAAIRKTAKAFDPEELRCATEYRDDILRELYDSQDDKRGFAPLLNKLDGRIRFRDAELIILNGVNGHGKSQLAGQFSLDAMIQEKRVCIASMEMPARRLLTRLTRQATGLKDGLPTQGYANAVIDWYAGRLWLFDLVGTAKTKRMMEVFEYARKRYGIDVFIIDNMSKCGIGDDDYNAQKAFMESLCDFKNQTGTTVFLVTHSRKGENEDQPTGKMDVKGSGSITDLSDSVLTIWRNKKKEEKLASLAFTQEKPDEDLINTPDSVIYCSKQRNGEWEGKAGVYWNGNAMQFTNKASERPRMYVKYSSPAPPRTEEEEVI